MFESIREFVIDTWSIPEARWIVLSAALIAAVFGAIFVASFFRRLAFGEFSTPMNDANLVEQIRKDGRITDKEYRDLKDAKNAAADGSRPLETKTAAEQNKKAQNEMPGENRNEE